MKPIPRNLKKTHPCYGCYLLFNENYFNCKTAQHPYPNLLNTPSDCNSMRQKTIHKKLEEILKRLGID